MVVETDLVSVNLIDHENKIECKLFIFIILDVDKWK